VLPEPDLVKAAVAKAGDGEAVMVGDSTWDCASGAVAVYHSIDELRDSLDEWLTS
jgi:phosphoglycolate phosphatase-like HAD superfamily hydrolase